MHALFRTVASVAGVGPMLVCAAFAGAPAPIPQGEGPHPEHLIASLGEFRMESGQVIKDFKVSYVTHGKLNKAKSNVVVVLQPFLADHHIYDFLISPGKALDTDKYFIVAPDFISNSLLRQGVTTGPTNSGLRMDFPSITIRDSTNVDYRLLKEYLGIDRVLAVVGPSIGAMKAYQFAVSYPTYISGAIAVAGSPVTSPRMRWVLRNAMDIIALDSGWQGGNYQVNPSGGLVTALLAWLPYLYSEKWFAQNLRTEAQEQAFRKTWRDVLTAYLPQDTRDVYYQMQMWANFNIGSSTGFNGDAQAALRSIKARVLLISAKEDQMISREEIAFTKGAIPGATLVELDSISGHDICCGSDPEANKILDREIGRFLATLK
jgi:homoserine O-acetyltransferase